MTEPQKLTDMTKVMLVSCFWCGAHTKQGLYLGALPPEMPIPMVGSVDYDCHRLCEWAAGVMICEVSPERRMATAREVGEGRGYPTGRFIAVDRKKIEFLLGPDPVTVEAVLTTGRVYADTPLYELLLAKVDTINDQLQAARDERRDPHADTVLDSPAIESPPDRRSGNVVPLTPGNEPE